MRYAITRTSQNPISCHDLDNFNHQNKGALICNRAAIDKGYYGITSIKKFNLQWEKWLHLLASS